MRKISWVIIIGQKRFQLQPMNQLRERKWLLEEAQIKMRRRQVTCSPICNSKRVLKLIKRNSQLNLNKRRIKKQINWIRRDRSRSKRRCSFHRKGKFRKTNFYRSPKMIRGNKIWEPKTLTRRTSSQSHQCQRNRLKNPVFMFSNFSQVTYDSTQSRSEIQARVNEITRETKWVFPFIHV